MSNRGALTCGVRMVSTNLSNDVCMVMSNPGRLAAQQSTAQMRRMGDSRVGQFDPLGARRLDWCSLRPLQVFFAVAGGLGE